VLPDGTHLHDQQIMDRQAARAGRLARRRGLGRQAGAECRGVGRDVTDPHGPNGRWPMRRDAAEAANRAQSRFLAMVSHEIPHAAERRHRSAGIRPELVAATRRLMRPNSAGSADERATGTVRRMTAAVLSRAIADARRPASSPNAVLPRA